MNRLKDVRPRLIKIGTSGAPVPHGSKRRTNWWRAVSIAVIVGALIGPSAAHAVNGIDLPGLNITKNGLEVQVGSFSVDAGKSTFGSPTGPTPITGGINAQAISVNGTPVVVRGTPTPLPTCASGQFLIGPGEPGSTCATAVPTATAVNTATPIPSQIAGAITASTPAAGTILYFPGEQGTPGVYVTPSAGGSSLTTIGPTFSSANVTMTNAITEYTGVTLSSALTNGKTYLISGSICFFESSPVSSTFTGSLYDSTNSVEIWSGNSQGSTVSDTGGTVTIPPIKYSGFSGTPTIIVRGESSNAGDTIISSAVNGAVHKATMVQAVQIG